MAGEARFLDGGARPLTAQFDDGAAFVWAQAVDSGGLAEKDIVGLDIRLVDGKAQWGAQKTFLTGNVFQPVGIVRHGGDQNDFVQVLIHGAVSDVTFPAAITRTSTNTAVRKNGTARLAIAAGFAASPPEHALAFAEITDAKTGAQTVRDLYMYGRWYMTELLMRSVGQFHHNATPAISTQSMLIDGDQKGWLECEADAGCTGGQLVQLRRGRTGTWRISHGTGGALANGETDAIFCYGVPEQDVTAAAGAKVRVQLLGPVNADLRAAVNTNHATDRYLFWSPGNNTITGNGGVPGHWKVLGVATERSTAQTQNIILFGRQFTN